MGFVGIEAITRPVLLSWQDAFNLILSAHFEIFYHMMFDPLFLYPSVVYRYRAFQQNTYLYTSVHYSYEAGCF